MRHHEVTQLVFNGNGALYESYLCLGSKTSKTFLLSSINVSLGDLTKVQERIEKLQKLDPRSGVETLINAFYKQEKVYIVNQFVEQGYSNLYRLAHSVQDFSPY